MSSEARTEPPGPGARAAFPVLTWLPGYQRQWLRSDLIAGVTSWAMVVPQAVAYGQIAGLPAQAGLAAAFAGPLGYALVGTSRQLMVSPTSSTAAISAAIAAPMAGGDLGRLIALSAALAMLTGAMLALLGFFKLGFVSQFLSLSVQTGFMFGLGMTIIVGQIPKLLGLPAAEGDFFESLWGLLTNLGQTNPWAAVLGLASLAVLLLLRRLAPRAPGPLIVVAAGIAVVSVLGLAERGVDVVGAIPAGLPLPALPAVSLADLLAILPAALGLAVIGYAESAAVAQGFATQHKYDITPDRELVGNGAANGLAGLFQGFMVGGGASQSAANDQAGARSQLASVIVAGLTLVTALFLTPLFFNLPQAVLGAIVINAVLGFFRVGELRRLAAIRRDSFWLAITSLVFVLVLGVLPGMLTAIVLSLLLLLGRASRLTVAVLGREPETGAFGDVARRPELQAVPGLLIVRPNGPFFFANARPVRDQVLAAARGATPAPRVVLIDLEMTAHLDVDGADLLAELRADLAGDGVEVWLAGTRAAVRDILVKSGYTDAAGAATLFPALEAAVAAFTQRPEQSRPDGDSH